MPPIVNGIRLLTLTIQKKKKKKEIYYDFS